MFIDFSHKIKPFFKKMFSLVIYLNTSAKPSFVMDILIKPINLYHTDVKCRHYQNKINGLKTKFVSTFKITYHLLISLYGSFCIINHYQYDLELSVQTLTLLSSTSAIDCSNPGNFVLKTNQLSNIFLNFF